MTMFSNIVMMAETVHRWARLRWGHLLAESKKIVPRFIFQEWEIYDVVSQKNFVNQVTDIFWQPQSQGEGINNAKLEL